MYLNILNMLNTIKYVNIEYMYPIFGGGLDLYSSSRCKGDLKHLHLLL